MSDQFSKGVDPPPAPHSPSRQASSSPSSLAEISPLPQPGSARGAQPLPSPPQGKQSASAKSPQVSLAHSTPVNPSFAFILPCRAGNAIYPTPPIHGKLVQEGPQHRAPASARLRDVGGMGASLEPRSASWLPLALLLAGYTAAHRLPGLGSCLSHGSTPATSPSGRCLPCKTLFQLFGCHVLQGLVVRGLSSAARREKHLISVPAVPCKGLGSTCARRKIWDVPCRIHRQHPTKEESVHPLVPMPQASTQAESWEAQREAKAARSSSVCPSLPASPAELESRRCNPAPAPSYL